MDETDKRILNELQKNSKIQYKKVAKKLNVATSTIHFRVKKMLKEGIIEKFSVDLNPDKVGYSTISWIGLSVDPRKMEEVAKRLSEYDDIQMVCTASGAHDILVKVIAKNEKELWRFINKKIKTIEGIGKNFDVSSFLDIYKNSDIIRL